jgi:hypothetical protein
MTSESAVESAIPPLNEATARLTRSLDHFPARGHHLIPDLALIHLALDVYEHCDIILHHPDPRTARGLWVNARAALEAAVEMLLLVCEECTYDVRGASVRAYELLDNQNLQHRFRKADLAAGVDPPSEPGNAEDPALAEADKWEELAPGQGRVMRQAFEHVQATVSRGAKHWSGKSWTDLLREVAEKHTLEPGAIEVIDTLYGTSSVHTHPRLRSRHRELRFDASGDISIVPGHDDSDAMRALAATAAHLAVIALERRLTFA